VIEIEDELVSVPEAARRLGGISVWTVHAWLARGILGRVKIGSRTMVRNSDLRELIRKGEGGKSPAPCRKEALDTSPLVRSMPPKRGKKA
jgi:hypothetical protein